MVGVYLLVSLSLFFFRQRAVQHSTRAYKVKVLPKTTSHPACSFVEKLVGIHTVNFFSIEYTETLGLVFRRLRLFSLEAENLIDFLEAQGHRPPRDCTTIPRLRDTDSLKTVNYP